MSGEKKGSLQSIRLHLVIGLAVVVILAGGLGGWASTAQISGALIAPGSVVVESNVKKVQHPTGGVVGEVRVRDGDVVKVGDVVVRAEDPDVKTVIASETKLFEVRVNGRAGQKAQLRERVTQLNEEIAGLSAQEIAKDKEIALVEKELVGVRSLYEQHLVQISRLTVLE